MSTGRMTSANAPSSTVWRQVPGFPGYEVSDAGRVRSMLKAGFGPAPTTPRVLRPHGDLDGYLRVHLRRDGRTFSRKLGCLVLEAFIGPRPDRHDACHNDGNRQNDALQNLRWDTRAGNLADTLQHGTRTRGARTGTAKLTDQDVREIRAALAAGHSQSTVAARHRIAQTTVSKIKRGTRWGWLA